MSKTTRTCSSRSHSRNMTFLRPHSIVNTSDRIAADVTDNCAPDKSTERGFVPDARWWIEVTSIRKSQFLKIGCAHPEGCYDRRIWHLFPARTTFPVKRFHPVHIPPFLRLIGTNRVPSDDTFPSVHLPVFDSFFLILQIWGRGGIDRGYWIYYSNLR